MSDLDQRLDALGYHGAARLHAIIQKPAVGIHVRVDRAEAVEGMGLEGDHVKKDWWKGERISERQVTAITREVMDALQTSVDVPGDNLVLEGVNLKALKPGSLVRIGPSVVLKRAQKIHRPCDLFARRISEEARQAVIKHELRGALFSVVHGGFLTLGDAVTIDPQS